MNKQKALQTLGFFPSTGVLKKFKDSISNNFDREPLIRLHTVLKDKNALITNCNFPHYTQPVSHCEQQN